MVYAATHLSLALLEQLVHLSPERLPAAFRAFAIELSADAAIEVGPETAPDLETSRRLGDEWTRSLRTAALVVPSALIPPSPGSGSPVSTERNVLLNPRHASAVAWRVTPTEFGVDPRLRRRARAEAE